MSAVSIFDPLLFEFVFAALGSRYRTKAFAQQLKIWWIRNVIKIFVFATQEIRPLHNNSKSGGYDLSFHLLATQEIWMVF